MARDSAQHIPSMALRVHPLTGLAIGTVVMEPGKAGRAVGQTATVTGTELGVVGNLVASLAGKVRASVRAAERVL